MTHDLMRNSLELLGYRVCCLTMQHACHHCIGDPGD